MTLAICLRCGAKKRGAFTPCPRCDFDPRTPEAQAKSLLLSDHNMTPDQLKSVAAEIEAGHQPTFDEAELQEMSAELADMDIPKIAAQTTWLMYGCFAVVIVVGGIGLLWWIFRW